MIIYTEVRDRKSYRGVLKDFFVRLYFLGDDEKMKLVLLFGPQAVGKMTVGQELAKITGLKLFHNHMTIDLVSNFFSYGTDEGKRLVDLYRMEMFKAVANSHLEGLIFTYTWCFNLEEDWEYTERICNIFKEKDANIYFIELEADLEERLKRNKTSNRIENKPTKRNLDKSEKWILEAEHKYRNNSYENEINEKNYLRINNKNISAKDVAKMIKEKFDL